MGPEILPYIAHKTVFNEKEVIMKKSVLMYVITVGLVVFVLTSCGKACGMPDAASAAKTDMYEDGNSAVVLTPEELRLLSDAFGEEERLKEGRLFSYQMEALSYLRDGMDYLEGRYQDRHFQYESFITANKFQPWAELRFHEGASRSCLVKIIPDEDGTVCEDNFYGVLLGDEYDRVVEQNLAQAGFPVRSHTIFIGTLGSAFPADATVKDIALCDTAPLRQTALYVIDPVPDEALVSGIKTALDGTGLYGDYWVYFTGQDIDGSIDRLEAGKSGWESLTFCCIPEP